jgi:hypothetical protein
MPKVPTREVGTAGAMLESESPMEVRLVQLLGSVITTTCSYALARLEFAMKHRDLPAPPLIDRLPDASAESLAARWAEFERQLDDARRFLRRIDDARNKRAVYDPSYAWLLRTTRELDQYARAVRWVMTVEEGR